MVRYRTRQRAFRQVHRSISEPHINTMWGRSANGVERR